MAPTFLDEVNAAVEVSLGIRCPVAKAAADMDVEDAEGLYAVLSDDRILGSVITDVLRKRGFSVGNRAVQNHRRGLCSCGRV